MVAMEGAGVRALRSIEIGVSDVAAAQRFFTETWGLTAIEADGTAAFLRGTGRFHHILALHRRDRAAIIRVTFDAVSRAVVNALHGSLASAGGAASLTDPGPLTAPGGGYGFDFVDGEGRRFGIVCDVDDHTDTGDGASRPHKLSHVVLNSDDAESASALFIDRLGFTLRDRTRMFNFLGCNRDHHCLSFAFGGGPTLNHIAFEMPDLESVMRGAGNLRDAGYPIEWGVGRHGPGNNVFAYFVGPDDYVVEYTAEVFQVDESYPVGKPEDWTWPPGRVDQWGVSPPPSERIKEAQTRIVFAEEA